MEAHLPTFIYGCEEDQLGKNNLLTGEDSSYTIPSHQFPDSCETSELPGGVLIITGGRADEFNATSVVVRIDTLREIAVMHQPPMLTARVNHCAVYHNDHLYILGGSDYAILLDKCERLVVADLRWEALPCLLQACELTSGVVHEGSLYALGGRYYESLDLIQRLSLGRLSTWEVIQVRLPQPGYNHVSFLHDHQVHFVLGGTLYSLHPLQALKTLTDVALLQEYIDLGGKTEDTRMWVWRCFYSRGILYYSNEEGPNKRLELTHSA
jgi:hypothetical protein